MLILVQGGIIPLPFTLGRSMLLILTSYSKNSKYGLTIDMTNHRITNVFSVTDIAFLDKCLGSMLTNATLSTSRTACQLTDGILLCNSNNGSASFTFQPFPGSKKSESLALNLEFSPQPWNIFGQYSSVKASWLSLQEEDMDQWQKETKKTSYFSLSFKMTPIVEWRIYGALQQGKRDNDDEEYGGDSFEVDLDLLLAFLGEDGQVFSCSFHRFPELSEGVFLGIYPNVNTFEETVRYGENYYGDKIFTLKRSRTIDSLQRKVGPH